VKRHVTFESWCERDHLIADFDPNVIAVADRPFSMRYVAATGSEHTPDFFVRTASGAAVVVECAQTT
jgi:hypothetical protein